MAKALLVDDEKDICLLLSGILEREGIETTCALNLEEAQNKLSFEEFQVAFIDLNLPDGTGSQLIPLIKRTNSDAKVVIISAYDFGLNKESQEGIDFLIKKPFSRSNILSVIHDLRLR
jgi:two-component system copper resistance phosphate regulon response regulator CusR